MKWTTWALCAALALPAGCAAPLPPNGGGDGSPNPIGAPRQLEVAFSPDAGAEALVLKVIASARQSVRLAGYTFTSPRVVQALIDAKKRGVDVQVLVDDRGNHGRANVAAQNLLVNAGIPTRTIAAYAIHHDKYIVVDGRTTETGSFNYSQAAARVNSENVLVVWNDPALAASYLAHWESRWAQGTAVGSGY